MARYSAALTPRSIVVADFDLDGDLDLAVANRHDNSISRLENQGDGTFQELPPIPVANPAWIAAGDFDGNGRVDLASVSTLSPVGTTLLNSAEGIGIRLSFTLGGAGHSFITSGHLDDDGNLDLVTIDRFSGRAAILRGAGAGRFSTPEPLDLALPTVDLDLVDVDGDGDLDLAAATASANAGQLVLFTSDAGRLLPDPEAIPLPFAPVWIASGDFGLGPEADGRADFVLASNGPAGGGVVWLVESREGGNHEVRKLHEQGAALTFLEIADVDKDGDRDVVFASADQTLRTLTNRGADGFSVTPWRYVEPLGTTVRHGVVAELDAAEDAPELAVTAFKDDNSRNELIVLALDRVRASLDLDGNGIPDDCESDCGPEEFGQNALPDCDRDGVPDACELTSRTIAFREIKTGPPSDDNRAVVTGDFNEDGHLDLATGPYSLLFGGGDGRFTSSGTSSATQSVTAADFDEDGHQDVAAATGEFGSFRLGWGRAERRLDVEHVAFTSGSPTVLAHGNLDERDLRPELVIISSVNTISVTVLGGTGRSFVELHRSVVGGLAWIADLAIRDFDGDGANDVLVVGITTALPREPAVALVFHGLRDGRLQIPDRSFTVTGVVSGGDVPMATGDFDRDGDFDFACGNPSSRLGEPGIPLFFNNGAGLFAPGRRLESSAVSHLATGDLLGDGVDDLVALSSSRLFAFSSHGDGRHFTSVGHLLLGGTWRRHAIGDWDGDGRQDVAVIGVGPYSDSGLISLINEPSALAFDCDDDGTPDDCEIAFGDESDCDGDGRIDRCAEETTDPCGGVLFAYGIEGPRELRAAGPGDAVEGEYRIVMTPLGQVRESGDGAQGWILSIAEKGCTIVEATTRGTAAASRGDTPPGLRDGGFEKTELASDGPVFGAVSAVLLSAILPVTLPATEPSVICRLQVHATAPAEALDELAGLTFLDGLKGVGQPVFNFVTWRGGAQRPALTAFGIRVGHGANAHRRGDANSDGVVDVSDSVFLLAYLFLGGKSPTCADAADSDDSGTLSLTDAVFVTSFLFLGSGPPPAPGPSSCGADPTPDLLSCDEYPRC